MESVKDIFGKRLFAIREAVGESQQELANILGITRQSLSRYELGERTINIDLLKKIALHYDVTTDYLLGLTDNKTTDINLQAVCEYTGLNEKAVSILHDFLDGLNFCNTGTSIDLSYLGFSDEFVREIISQNDKLYSETLQETRSWIIYSHFLNRIASQLSTLTRLSTMYKKISDKFSEMKFDDKASIGDPNNLMRLDTNCDVARYMLVKLSEDMANEFDQRK